MSSKKGILMTAIIIVLGIALAYLVVMIVMDLNGKINQGSCRFIDVVTISNLEVEDNSEELESLQESEELKLFMNQKNSIDIVLAPASNIKEAYIDNISIVNPLKLGEIVVYQNEDNQEKKNVKEIKEKYPITADVKDDEYKININFDNENFLKEVNIPEGMTYIKFDGKILKDYKLNFEDMKFTVKFNLNVVDAVGNVSTSKMEFEFPSEKFINEGIDITQKSLDDFIFKSK